MELPAGFHDFSPVKDAAGRIRPWIHRTPVLTSSVINEIAENELFFKCENFQKAGAFKSRGAINAVFSTDDSLVTRGVCTHSSGNHAAALSRAASLKNIPAFIVMPENSSRVKVDAVRHYGGDITFCYPSVTAREKMLERVKKRTGAFEVHPYDNRDIICGQATACMELLEEIPGLDIVMAPVGGGGLLSGTALSTFFLSPETLVIGAEPAGADDAFRSLREDRIIPSVNPETIADGLRTSLGDLNFRIIRQLVKEILTVDEDFIVRAMRLTWERMKIIIEPSSAVPLGVILQKKLKVTGRKIGIIISGGNVDLDHLPWIT